MTTDRTLDEILAEPDVDVDELDDQLAEQDVDDDQEDAR